MLNMEEHNRSLDEGEARPNQGETIQHHGNLHATNIRQSSNSQQKRNSARPGRIEGREHLRESRLLPNTGSLEPRSSNLEKPRKARNELPYIEQAMQRNHHRQHSLVPS